MKEKTKIGRIISTKRDNKCDRCSKRIGYGERVFAVPRGDNILSSCFKEYYHINCVETIEQGKSFGKHKSIVLKVKVK